MVELMKTDSNRVLVTDVGYRKRQYRLDRWKRGG
jgi:hypothetical protein